VDDGEVDAAGSHEPGTGDAETVAGGDVDEIQKPGRSQQTRIEGRLRRRGGLVAMRAIHVEIGSCATLERDGDVILLFRSQHRGELRLVDRGREKAESIQGPELVCGVTGRGIEEIAVEVTRFHPEHFSGGVGVAGRTFIPTGEMPGPRRAVRGEGLDDGLAPEQLGIAAVDTPAIGETKPGSVIAVEKKPRLETATAHFEMLDQDGADGEGPVALFGPGNPLCGSVRGAVVREHDPAFFCPRRRTRAAG